MTTQKEVAATIKAQAKRIEKLESALRVIHTWATFYGKGMEPLPVINLCEKALKDNTK